MQMSGGTELIAAVSRDNLPQGQQVWTITEFPTDSLLAVNTTEVWQWLELLLFC